MNMDKNDSFDGPLQGGQTYDPAFLFRGNREFTISSDKISLYVGGIPYDTKPMLDILRGSGVDPGKLSPARWISLLRGQPTRLPGCEKPFMLFKAPSGYTLRCLEITGGQEQGFPDGNVV
ncbi:hypothetical protein NXV14_17520 [Bacteroides fragilis]|nr:hypothetical protein [Bacteroides fragilis]